MRYRRLGRTQQMVSEVGIDIDALRDVEHDEVMETLRAAFVAGVTVLTWHVADSLDDVEPLIVEAAKSERGRLTLVAILDRLPEATELGAQVGAIASRLGGELDVIAFPEAPNDAHVPAIAEARARGIVRFIAYAGSEALSPTQTGMVDVIVGTEPQRIVDLGVIALGEMVATDVDSTAIPIRSAEAVRAAIAVASLT